METDRHSQDIALQADGGEGPLPPYLLTRGDIGLWLQRGELLGRAACRIAATVAAAHRHAAKWRRQVASNGPGHPPPAPG